VGQVLVPVLGELGHEPIPLVRAKSGREVPVGWRAYDPLEVARVQAALEGVDAVVNLAGENIIGRRWNDAVRADLRSSRADTTRVLVRAMAALSKPPQVLVSASAVGIYGARGPAEPCLEDDAGHDPSFLARLCRDWEAAASGAEQDGTRVVALRIGMILGRGGGLKKMELPFRLGLGGRVGSGKQIVSWIHIEDLCRLIVFSLNHEPLSGPVNATAPAPVTNAELTRALAAQLHRPAFLPVPAFAVKLLLGPAADVLLTGQRVLPSAAQEAGFVFRHETIAAAFEDLYRD
jgi:uncharacterized protein (TIGR01777 family)